MQNLKIYSHNARGLNQFMKRRKLFRNMRKHKADIVLLQEIYGIQKTNAMWESEWGMRKTIFANGSSNSRGVCVLFSKRVGNKVDEVIRDINGRYIICKLSVGGYSYAIANIYAPNSDNLAFFNGIFNCIESLNATFYYYWR